MKFTDYLTLTEGVNDPAIFKVVFLAGGPGSGKSFMAKKTAFQSMGFTVINSDDAFEHMMRKGGLDFKMPESQKTERDAVRDKAKSTTDKKQQLAIQGRLGMVIDGTGRDADKIMKLKAKFEEQGYETAMMFVNTDLDTALKRNAARERSVPEDMAKKLWSDVQGNIGAFQHAFGKQFHVVDNSEGANFDEQTLRVFKDVGKWAKQAPKSPEAKKWIADNSPKGAVDKTEEPSAKKAPVAADKTAPAPTKATPTPAADASQGAEKPDGVKEPYKIKCVDKRPPHQVKIANVVADTEDEALKIVRNHGFTPMEVNGRALRESVMSVMQESTCDIISMQQLKDLEKFGDRLLQKFDIDVEFTKHFGERMSDSRNTPCIKVAELQALFKKISKDKGAKVKQHADHEAVLKDIQSDLNLPFIAKPTKDGEIDLVLKTIMRKKDFKSPDPEVRYESYEDVCPECHEHPCQCGNGLVDESIIQVGDKWRLVSKKTGKNLGTFDTKAEAEKHEREVQFFKHQNEETVMEGRPSQRHPLEGHPYHSKTDAELAFIGKDAHKAAQAMRGHNTDAENKYMDQANDAATVRYWRQKNGTPAWYKKKYGIKESVEMPLYVQEAAYAGNIGMMELIKFYQKSTEAEKKHLQDLIKKGMSKEAWKLVQDKTGTQLVGKEFHESTVIYVPSRFRYAEDHIANVIHKAHGSPAMHDVEVSFNNSGKREVHVNGKKHLELTKHLNKTLDSVREDTAVAANSVSGGGVDMNPTGVGKWDKRSKFHINHMFRRADGTKYGKKKSLNEKD